MLILNSFLMGFIKKQKQFSVLKIFLDFYLDFRN